MVNAPDLEQSKAYFDDIWIFSESEKHRCYLWLCDYKADKLTPVDCEKLTLFKHSYRENCQIELVYSGTHTWILRKTMNESQGSKLLDEINKLIAKCNEMNNLNEHVTKVEAIKLSSRME